ncbi:MBL fold metallo-hydrolase, partial [Vibrio owensii]|uniref:MBL fold metallo-hydrolase n=1 Tax=Vibrio owensii TaxID=696485 RepID=UPI001A7E6C49
ALYFWSSSMLRSFHPVGQGAFYTEEFSGFTAVYDCGTDTIVGTGKSATRENTIKKEIFSVFNNNARINVLFISHFHQDHVNGLQCLLSRCNVDYIVLPYLQDFARIELLISSYAKNSQFLNDLILDPTAAINKASPKTKVIYVKPFEVRTQEGQIIQLESLDNGDFIDSSTAIHSRSIKSWEYIPCNFDYTSRSQTLKTELSKNNLTISNVKDFKALWCKSKKRTEIKNVYKKLKGNFNATTMSVYSGPYGDEKFGQISHEDYFSLFYGHMMPACLYLGDFEASKHWNDLDSVYGHLWNNIGVIQIPHHGSKENYTDKLNSTPYIYSVISAGSINSHRHPHSYTTGEIIKKRGIMRIVTESPATRFQLSIEKKI